MCFLLVLLKKIIVLLESILGPQAEIKELSTAFSINLALATNVLIYLRKEKVKLAKRNNLSVFNVSYKQYNL